MGANYFNWSGREWIDKEVWGRVHPKKPYYWYSPERVDINYSTGVLHLSIKKEKFSNSPILIGGGLVSTTETFLYGEFEIEAKLPNHSYAWPAFWMWGGSWPPEIDVFEGYANHKGSYFKFRPFKPFSFWNVQTNVHYKNIVKNSIGSSTHYWGFKNPSKHFIKYKVIWTKEKIEFYYDNRLVRVVDDKKVLKLMNKPMRVIINTSIKGGINRKNIDEFKVDNCQDYQIKYFKYKPLKT